MISLLRPSSQIELFDHPRARTVLVVLMVIAAFGIYWFSSFILEAGDATTKFAADSFFYTGLAVGEVSNRELRFHPLTVITALAWMKVLSPLTVWITPLQLLKAMSATVGALGLSAAIWAFSAVVPRRDALVCGVIYACSLDVWFFSSIEESKIITATLAVLYIAIYLHLRNNWSRRGAAMLTVVLLLACLNEIVTGFLIIIPIVDTLVRRGFDWRREWWIAVHGLVGPFALFILEVVIGGLVPRPKYQESATELGHLLYWLSQAYYSVDNFYSFAVKWLFFSIAAPTTNASFEADLSIKYAGGFEPVMAHYLTSPQAIAVVVLFCVMIIALVLPRYRPSGLGNLAPVLWGLFAYALVRGIFFAIYLPGEPLVNSAASLLAHLLIILVLFTASKFPAKQWILVAFAAALFVNNGLFFISQ